VAQSFGPYTLGEPLGRGGMGMVFRAVDGRSGGEVALKVLTTTDEQARKRLVREAKALERLAHPNVVKILDAGEERGRPWIAVELVPGGSLEARLERLGPLPPAAAAQAALGVARALAHAHAQGVLHRDVKPGNVLLAANGEVKLGDFGLAGFHADLGLSRLTRSGALAGSPGWWAPEQATGDQERIGPATDVYGLGATLYAALTGRPPIEAASVQELFVATVEVEPAPPGVDATLDAVALRCLAKDPGDRYPAAGDVAAELERWLEGGARATPVRRGKALLARLGGAALLAAGLLAALVAARGRASPPAAPAAPAAAPAAPAAAPAAPAAPDRRGEAEALRRQALPLLGDGENAAAIALLDSAVALDPRSALALADRALALLRSGETARGGADAEAALALDPHLPMAWSRRGKARMLAGDLPGALADACMAAALDPRSARLRTDRGTALVLLGASAEGLDDLDAAVALDPELAMAWEQRGVTRANRGDLRGGLRDLDRAVELAPRAASVRAARGAVRAKEQDLAGAREDLDRAIALDPRHVEALVNRGGLRSGAGDLVGALEDFDRAVALAPGLARPLVERSLALSRARRHADALADLDAAIAISPDARLYSRRAVSRWETVVGTATPDPRPALADHDRAVELAPDDPTIRARRARLLATIGEHAAAIADLDRAVQLEPKDGMLRYERGDVRARAGEVELAIADWEAAARLDPRLESDVRRRILRARP
jgi:tetratricopeptide (TPR) repeat protein